MLPSPDNEEGEEEKREGGSEREEVEEGGTGGRRGKDSPKMGDEPSLDADEQAGTAKGRKRRRPGDGEKKSGGRPRKDSVGGDSGASNGGGGGDKPKSSGRKRAAAAPPPPRVDEEVDMSAAAAMLGSHWLKPVPGLVSAAAAPPPTPPQASSNGAGESREESGAPAAPPPTVPTLGITARKSAVMGAADKDGASSSASASSSTPASSAASDAPRSVSTSASDDGIPVTPYTAMTAPMLRACRCCSNTTIATPASISGAHVFFGEGGVSINGGSSGGSSGVTDVGVGGGGGGRDGGGGGGPPGFDVRSLAAFNPASDSEHTYDTAGERALLGSYPIWDDGYYSSKSDDDLESDDESGGDAQRTSYSKQRSRRTNTRRESSVQSSQMSEAVLMGLDPHTMVIPEPYAKGVVTPSHTTRPSCGALSDPTTQPFSIQVHPDCHFICDFHAHLADSEIIGLLGGYWDRDNRVLYIQVRSIISY